jgi:hypothetical protein
MTSMERHTPITPGERLDQEFLQPTPKCHGPSWPGGLIAFSPWWSADHLMPRDPMAITQLAHQAVRPG